MAFEARALLRCFVNKGRCGEETKGSPRATEPGVDLDDTVLPRVGVQRVLDVALSDDTEMANDLQSSGPQHVVLVVRQGLRGRDDDRVAGVRAEGVEVLHVAADDRVLRER